MAVAVLQESFEVTAASDAEREARKQRVRDVAGKLPSLVESEKVRRARAPSDCGHP